MVVLQQDLTKFFVRTIFEALGKKQQGGWFELVCLM